MPNGNNIHRLDAARPGIATAYLDDREAELQDAIIVAAAMVARADGLVQAVEYDQLIEFLDGNEFLSLFTRAELREALERRVRVLREPGGPVTALAYLRRHAGHSLAHLIIDAGKRIAAADSRLDPREQRILELIRVILRWHPSASAPGPDRPGEGA